MRIKEKGKRKKEKHFPPSTFYFFLLDEFFLGEVFP